MSFILYLYWELKIIYKCYILHEFPSHTVYITKYIIKTNRHKKVTYLLGKPVSRNDVSTEGAVGPRGLWVVAAPIRMLLPPSSDLRNY